jgi:hypothetical protein
MNGTMLISESDDPVSRCICGIVFCQSKAKN